MSAETSSRSRFTKWRMLVVTGVVIIPAIIVYGISRSDTKPTPKVRKIEIVNVTLPPPPPPPPPPPEDLPPPEPEEPEMIEQEPIAEAAPEEPDPAPPEEPPASLGTGLTGEGGPDGFGLSNRGNGGRGNGGGVGRAGGGRFGSFAAALQNTFAAQLRRNPVTRRAVFEVEVSIRVDDNGRITSVRLKSSTGDPEIDRALRQDFIGTQLAVNPPADMPMPIHTRLRGTKPR